MILDRTLAESRQAMTEILDLYQLVTEHILAKAFQQCALGLRQARSGAVSEPFLQRKV
jgi:hypothetical protein